MTRQVTAGDGGLTIVLPGTWRRVPLGSPEQTAAAVKRLIRSQVGVDDRLARVRREAREEILGNAREALALGVHTYLMSLELLPGIPFPSAMLMLDEPWPVGSEEVSTDPAGMLSRAFPEARISQGSQVPVARVGEVARGKVGEEELLTLRLVYRLPYPDGSRVLTARVNVSGVPAPEPVATLFDEIVDSIRFVGVPEPGEG